MATSQKILIVGPAWIGDMVMAQSLFITLKQRYPDCEIDVLAPAWSQALLARMPEVRAAIEMPLGHGEFGFSARRRLGIELRTNRYDQAIVLPRSWKSALVPFFARIPQRTGYRGEFRYGLLNDIRPLDKSVLTQTVQRQVALGLAPDATLPPVIPQPTLRMEGVQRDWLLRVLNLYTDRPIVALLPGAEYGPAKRWPVEYYAWLARRLVKDGYAIWVFGSEKEKPLGEIIVNGLGAEAVNLCGRTRLVDASDLLSLAQVAVTNDSGLMHVTAAMGVRVIAIYGSSSPDYTPPLTDKADIVYLRLECSPCFQRECPLGHTNCLKQITVEDIYRRVTND
ncbi:MAG TPA: lipopolysaccharide heptosyltransferase II [Gammaproteobacteria bacterium]|nr:lipopolysaccharide heptosyltransferase II [Gammaproteobacteria bacterium]